MGELQIWELGGPEPPEVIVLFGFGVDRLPVPARDEERVQLEGRVADRHREGSGVLDTDPKFFKAFPSDGLLR
jgi:hypothetical protein